MRRPQQGQVSLGFENQSRRLSIESITPLRLVNDAIKKSPKYRQIASSIREVGLVEPPVVAPDKGDPNRYLLLDGHLRIAALQELGLTDVVCLISTDDEAFTYNRRINRLAIIQEHKMIVKAIERGVSEERLARALNVDVENIRRKRHLLNGICPEAADLLKDKHISIHALGLLKKLKPFRQMEAAELMVAMNQYTISYARSIVAASTADQLVKGKYPAMRGLPAEQSKLMQRESALVDREFRAAQHSYGSDHLDLVLAKGYLAKLLGNGAIARFLSENYAEILTEFQRTAAAEYGLR